MENTGIIVYKGPYTTKKTVLHDTNVVQHVYISTEKLMPIGSLVVYMPRHKGDTCFGTLLSIDDLPLLIAKDDIFFLHHVFELVYAFMPVGKNVDGVFEHVFFLYSESIHMYIQNVFWKKLFIGRLLFLLDMYKEEQRVIISFLRKINHLPIDRMIVESLDLAEEEALNNWLLTIFTMHQKLNTFKITYFTGQYGKI